MYGKTAIDRRNGRSMRKHLKRQVHKWHRREGKRLKEDAPAKNCYVPDYE